MFSEINIIAVVIAAIANMALGAVWYAPPLFGKAWMELAGITPTKVKEAEPHVWKFYLIGLGSSVLMAFVLAFILSATSADLLNGFLVAFLLWAGFVATISLNAVIWGGRPIKLWLLDNAYYLLSFLIMSGIFYYMK